MKSTRKSLAAASVLLIFLINVFSGNTLTCHPETEYPIGDECCPLCPPGKRVKTDCTEYRSTSCLPCVNRTSFTTHPNGLRECFPCASCGSANGLFARHNLGKSLADDTGCSIAEKHTLCARGQRIKEPGKKNLSVTSLTDVPSLINGGLNSMLHSCVMHLSFCIQKYFEILLLFLHTPSIDFASHSCLACDH
uniref:TNFR-Cys domain-containing protein n=1 Tax=Scophthalmus maximus TaxID=52904 RepID=A0A8D3D034_SCOMX